MLVSALFVGCSSENKESVNTNVDDLFDKFLAGEINTDGNELYGKESFNISELQMDEKDWASYSVGNRIDLDNDGEDELILNGPCGGMYLNGNYIHMISMVRVRR